MSVQTTPLSELGLKKEPAQETPQRPPSNPTAAFAQMPGNPKQEPVTTQMHTEPGPGQGISSPVKKEFFTELKNTDLKTVLLVFAIILILSSGIFYSVLRPYIPGAIGSDGKVTLSGSFIAAVIGTFIFIAVKAVGKF